ncbi:hypothetical protein FUAX_55040 (plasmid) [Fulvitalea axinellae]|uniref:Uncharacterized protein n=2 Tax=Fulvitalea axinellae TaxID=1182444 RepID=A0AAU9D6Q9_9BACT|nr:hypothetical protein FUAX_55040 [Fulvitalea axinellae]
MEYENQYSIRVKTVSFDHGWIKVITSKNDSILMACTVSGNPLQQFDSIHKPQDSYDLTVLRDERKIRLTLEDPAKLARNVVGNQ